MTLIAVTEWRWPYGPFKDPLRPLRPQKCTCGHRKHAHLRRGTGPCTVCRLEGRGSHCDRYQPRREAAG